MKGLLIKDFHLAFRNSRNLLMFVIICLVMSLSLDPSFGVGYAILLMGTIALGTLTYDEFENGFPFLMSLPADAKTYVREKFLFCFLCELGGAIFGLAFAVLASLIRGQQIVLGEYLSFAAGVLPAMLLMLAIMIAIQLKYGVEKSRLVMILIYGGFAGIAVFIAAQKEKIIPVLPDIAAFLQKQPPVLLVGSLLLVLLLLIWLLYRLSVRIMENKEV